MNVVDTNVLLRYLLADESPPQARAALRFIDGECSSERPAIVTSVVLAELVWVLRSRYRFSKSEILAVLDSVAHNENIAFDAEEEVLPALQMYRDKAGDLADCLIAARASALGATPVMTFDRDAGRLPGFKLLHAGP